MTAYGRLLLPMAALGCLCLLMPAHAWPCLLMTSYAMPAMAADAIYGYLWAHVWLQRLPLPVYVCFWAPMAA